MIELHFSQKNPQVGDVKITLRVIGSNLYFKFSASSYADQVIAQLSSRGAKIEKGNGWIRVDMFSNKMGQGQQVFKLGDKEIDFEEDTASQIESKLADFYRIQYVKAGFSIE